MGIWKRAYLYITRKKVRSILLFFIFLVVGLFLLTGISIRKSAGEEADNFRKTLTTGIRVESIAGSVPYEDIIDENGEKVIDYKASLIREHHIEEFLAIEGVSGFYCNNLQSETAYTGLTLHPGFNSGCLDIINGKASLEETVSEEEIEYMVENRKCYETDARSNRFLMTYDSEWNPAFINGGVELVEGRHIRVNDEAKVVISDEVANKNGLKVGDQITAQLSDVFTGELYGRKYETEIVGIFHINFDQAVLPDKTYENDILANTFFSTPDIDSWSRREYQVEYGYTVHAPVSDDVVCLLTIFVEDPVYLDSVKEKLLAMDSIDWEYYTFGVYDKDYQTAAAPLLSMMKVSNLLVIVPAVGVLVILYLVLAIWMRSRKNEIGILISTGMKKNALRQQFLLECCSIAAAAFFTALLLAGPVTKLAGNGLQKMFYSSGETEKYEVEIEMYTSDMYINLLPPKEGEALLYEVTWREACTVFLILVGTAAAAVLASSAELTGQKPREILGKR